MLTDREKFDYASELAEHNKISDCIAAAAEASIALSKLANCMELTGQLYAAKQVYRMALDVSVWGMTDFLKNGVKTNDR